MEGQFEFRDYAHTRRLQRGSLHITVDTAERFRKASVREKRESVIKGPALLSLELLLLLLLPFHCGTGVSLSMRPAFSIVFFRLSLLPPHPITTIA